MTDQLAHALLQARTHPAALNRLRERIGLTTEAARRAGRYLAAAPHRPIAPSADAVAALEIFRRPLQDESIPARDVLAELDAFGSPATIIQGVGRYFGYVNGGVEPVAAAAAILADAWDQNVALRGMSLVGSVLDEVAAGWIVDLLGLPSDAVATFTAGATLANFTAIVAARDTLLARAGWSVEQHGLAGAPPTRVIAGAEVDASALKSLRMAGLGPGAVERVPVDASGAIDADAFPADTDALTLVLLQAGNVTSGSSDPFARIIPGVRERGGWVHVDGAFGLRAAASPTRKHLGRRRTRRLVGDGRTQVAQRSVRLGRRHRALARGPLSSHGHHGPLPLHHRRVTAASPQPPHVATCARRRDLGAARRSRASGNSPTHRRLVRPRLAICRPSRCRRR